MILRFPSSIVIFCPLYVVRKSHPTSHIESAKLANSLGESVECELCQYAMGYLDALLGKKATEDEIVNAVKNLCSYLPEYINTQVIGSWLLALGYVLFAWCSFMSTLNGFSIDLYWVKRSTRVRDRVGRHWCRSWVNKTGKLFSLWRR